MTKEDTDLIGEAIDFYNLNHFKGKETKKRLVKLKKELQALIIPVVGVRSEQLICDQCYKYKKTQGNGIMHKLCECGV